MQNNNKNICIPDTVSNDVMSSLDTDFNNYHTQEWWEKNQDREKTHRVSKMHNKMHNKGYDKVHDTMSKPNYNSHKDHINDRPEHNTVYHNQPKQGGERMQSEEAYIKNEQPNKNNQPNHQDQSDQANDINQVKHQIKKQEKLDKENIDNHMDHRMLNEQVRKTSLQNNNLPTRSLLKPMHIWHQDFCINQNNIACVYAVYSTSHANDTSQVSRQYHDKEHPVYNEDTKHNPHHNPNHHVSNRQQTLYNVETWQGKRESKQSNQTNIDSYGNIYFAASIAYNKWEMNAGMEYAVNKYKILSAKVAKVFQTKSKNLAFKVLGVTSYVIPEGFKSVKGIGTGFFASYNHNIFNISSEVLLNKYKQACYYNSPICLPNAILSARTSFIICTGTDKEICATVAHIAYFANDKIENTLQAGINIRIQSMFIKGGTRLNISNIKTPKILGWHVAIGFQIND